MANQVQTVLGPIDASSVGITLMHEHILSYAPHVAKAPGPASQRGEFNAPFGIEMVGRVRFGGVANKDNCDLTDVPTAIDELGKYGLSGGRTVCDATSIGIGRDPAGLARIARATGLNIVMGASYYVEETHPEDHRTADTPEEALAERIIGDLMIGAEGTDIRAGMIGEVGTSWPITATEAKVLRASVRAQLATGALLMVHPGRDRRAPFAIMDILREAKADLSRTVLCHIDRTLGEHEEMLALARFGCVIEFDLFGFEGSYYAWSLPVDMPNDAARVNKLKALIASGFGEQLVISHDIFFKDKLTRYGGHGYAHILDNVVPLMRRKGIEEPQIRAMLVETPRRLLAFA